MAFQDINLEGPDDPDNETDFSAWTKIKTFWQALVGLTPAANKILVWTGATTAAFQTFTAKAIELCSKTTASEMLTVLGVSVQGRNVIPNGDFRVAQLGAGPFTSATTPANNDATYLLDGCILLSDGNDIVDVSQTRTVTPGGSVGGDAAIALDVETANKKFGIFIPIEARDAKRLIAGDAVLSFQARRGSNATVLDLRAAIVSWQGTEDSITRDIVSAWGASGTNPTLAANWSFETTPADLTLTTSFQKFAESNGLAGAIDTASTKNIGIFIWYNKTDATVADFVYITDIQLEKGLVATDFEFVPYASALLRNQRFFEKNQGSNGRAFFNGMIASGSTYYAVVWFRATKRTTPTLSGTNGAVNGFGSSVGTFFADVDAFEEGRAATGTQNLGTFSTDWQADARL